MEQKTKAAAESINDQLTAINGEPLSQRITVHFNGILMGINGAKQKPPPSQLTTN